MREADNLLQEGLFYYGMNCLLHFCPVLSQIFYASILCIYIYIYIISVIPATLPFSNLKTDGLCLHTHSLHVYYCKYGKKGKTSGTWQHFL